MRWIICEIVHSFEIIKAYFWIDVSQWLYESLVAQIVDDKEKGLAFLA